MKGAKGTLLNVTGGPDMSLHEVRTLAEALGDAVDPTANIIFGASVHPNIGGRDQSDPHRHRIWVLSNGDEWRSYRFRYIRLPDRESVFVGTLLAHDERRLIMATALYPREPVRVHDEVVIDAGSWEVWFLFQGRSFDVARIYGPDGFRGYYVDALQPVHWQDDDPETLEPLVDLFLDLWIRLDGRWSLLDQDELDAAQDNGVITRSAAVAARETLMAISVDVNKGLFPPAEVANFQISEDSLRLLMSRPNPMG